MDGCPPGTAAAATSTELTATNPQGPGHNAHCAGYWLAQEVAAPTAKVAEPSAGLSMGLSAEQRSQAGAGFFWHYHCMLPSSSSRGARCV